VRTSPRIEGIETMSKIAWTLSLVLCLSLIDLCVGSYRFGSLSWRLVNETGVAPNTVDFELVTAWKRSFQWVFVSKSPNPRSDEYPVVGDKIRLTGVYFGSSSNTGSGTSQILFYTGDGKQYFVDIIVTAFSKSEDWIMGRTIIRHTYMTPYNPTGKTNFYPADFSYQASSGSSLDAYQPYWNTPWQASFVGCCRSQDLATNKNKVYKLVSYVDLTNRHSSLVARTLPVVTVNQSSLGNYFYVLAKDAFALGGTPLKVLSGGNTNYPVDDNHDVNITYQLAHASDLDLPNSDFTAMTGVSVDSATGLVTVSAGSGTYQLAIRVDICTPVQRQYSQCNASVLIDLWVKIVPDALPIAAGDEQYIQHVDGWVGFSISTPVTVRNAVMSPLILNYVFSNLTVEATRTYKADQAQQVAGMPSNGLPPGASLASTYTDAIVDIKLVCDNPPAKSKFNSQSYQFVNAPGAIQLWNLGYQPILKNGSYTMSDIHPNALSSSLEIAAHNLINNGSLFVSLWVKKSSTDPAVTEMFATNSRAEADKRILDGYSIVSGYDPSCTSIFNGMGYILYKRGNGPAITSISVAKQASFYNISSPFLTAPLYFSTVSVNILQRSLRWTPQYAGYYVFCYVGTYWPQPTTALSSTQRCILYNIREDPGPLFVPHASLSTTMGKLLYFNVTFRDINHVDEIVSISFDTQGLTLTGASFLTNVVEPYNALWKSTTRLVEWFPDSMYGGFAGDVCFVAQDVGGPFRTQHSSLGCVHISVARCKWYVQAEDSIVQVAARFATNWLQIWHFNPTLLNPDLLNSDTGLPSSREINIGHLYQIEPHDSVASLAQRFGTSDKHIYMNNWDVARIPPEQIPVGYTICIIPNSCVSAAA